MELNRPDTVAEVERAFIAYERALVDNDVETMNALFWNAPETVRYGIAEVQHGGDVIRHWRETCAPVPRLSNRIRRENEPRLFKKRAALGFSHDSSRCDTKPGVMSKSGPSCPDIWYATKTSPLVT